MIDFACPKCGMRLRATQAMFGKHVRCPGCKDTARAPEPIVATLVPQPSLPDAATFTPIRSGSTWKRWATVAAASAVLVVIASVIAISMRPEQPRMSREVFVNKAQGGMGDVTRSLGNPNFTTSRTRDEAVPGGYERVEDTYNRIASAAAGGAGGRKVRRLQTIWVYQGRTIDPGTKKSDSSAMVIFENGFVFDVEFNP